MKDFSYRGCLLQVFLLHIKGHGRGAFGSMLTYHVLIRAQMLEYFMTNKHAASIYQAN